MKKTNYFSVIIIQKLLFSALIINIAFAKQALKPKISTFLTTI